MKYGDVRALLEKVTTVAQAVDRELNEEELALTALATPLGTDESRMQSLRALSVALWNAQDALVTATKAARQLAESEPAA